MKKVMKAIAAIMLMTAVVCIVGCKKTDDSNNGGDNNSGNGGNSFNNHEYVDLGLPSGLLWATCNVGAETPEDYGDYLAWGENWTKDYYSWRSYQYGNNDTGWKRITKYCNNSSYGYNGYTDDLTILLPEDDAATANWGNGWRMPTYDECMELRDNTTHTWTTQNGVNGLLVTATNGNSLFLPAAGVRGGDVLFDAASFGKYWSSSLDTRYPDGAWGFDFNSNNYRIIGYDRANGLTVRPVCSSRQN